ncbi:MAG: TIR domain-containing protein [Desulfobaccales bacterium]
MSKNLAAFVSYAHLDDEYEGRAITHLASRLEGALRAFTGKKDQKVFFDRASIDWGDAWKACIDLNLTKSSILIPIVTPFYLSSEECRKELEQFLSLPEGEHWLLPIYYREVTDFDTRDDAVSRAVRKHQWDDWRELRTTGRASAKVRKAIEKPAKRIRDLLQTARLPDQSSPVVVQSETYSEYRAQAPGVEAEGDDWIDFVLNAQAATDDEEYGLARALLLSALDRFPDEPELMHELAIVDWYDGALDASVVEFEQALAKGIDRITVLQGLGQARVELGDFERGIEELTEVIEHHPDHIARTYARSTRALGYGGIGKFQEAIEELTSAERVTPDNAWLHFNRARVLDWLKDPGASASYIHSLILNSPPLNRPKRKMAQRRLLEIGWRA